VLASIDFTTIEVWSKSGLVTCYLLFVMELATRRALFAGCTPNPDDSRMHQATRNLSDAEDGFHRGKKYILMDRDAKFSEAFRVTLKQVGTEAVRSPPRSPDLNPHLERFMQSVKEECLERMVFFGERSLQVAVVAFLAHYHAERNHQALDNRLIHSTCAFEWCPGNPAWAPETGLRSTTSGLPSTNAVLSAGRVR
jgi:putative transposase